MKQYKLEDILINLDSINMSRAILSDGKNKKICKSIFLNPYVYMNSFGCESDPKSISPTIDWAGNRAFRTDIVRIKKEIEDFLVVEYNHIENILCGISYNRTFNIIMKHKRKCIKKSEERYLRNNEDKVSLLYKRFGFNPDRIYPLSECRYHQFAREKYYQLKSPKFNKQTINSIRFGRARIEYRQAKIIPSNSKINGPGSWQKKAVCQRHIGLVQYRKPNKHVSLAFEMENGMYVLHKRVDGSKPHLWKNITYKLFMKQKSFYGTDSRKTIKKIKDRIRERMDE